MLTYNGTDTEKENMLKTKERFAREVAAEETTGRVRHLINVSGTARRDQPILEITQQEYFVVMRSDLKGQ